MTGPDLPQTDHPDADTEHEEQPIGTFVLMILFLLVIAAMWGWAYFTLLERG